MVKSMTAFSQAERTEEGLTVAVEIRSYNSRNLDIALHMPQAYRCFEEKIRSTVAARAERGRISVRFEIRIVDGVPEYEIDQSKALAYYNALSRLKETLGLDGEISLDQVLAGGEVITPIEDDMDIWPYDLDVMMQCINNLQGERSYQKVQQIAKTLKEEFRPLRGRRDNVGSDIRFPYFAKMAGYTLYGEPDVRIHHHMNYPLAPEDYTLGYKEPGQQQATKITTDAIVKKRKDNRKRLKGLKDSEYKQGVHIEGIG